MEKIHKKLWIMPFAIVSLYAKLLEFVIKSLSVYGKQLGCLALVASRHLHSLFYALLLCLLVMKCHGNLRLDMAHALSQFILTNIVARGKECGALHHVVEFPEIARPTV